MSVDTLLALNPQYLESAWEPLQILRRIWDQQLQPTDAQGLIRVLKLTLDRCQREGIVYPRIFLRRKGELQRGEFQPQLEIRSLPNPAATRFSAAGHPQIPAEWINQAVNDFSARLAPKEKG